MPDQGNVQLPTHREASRFARELMYENVAV